MSDWDDDLPAEPPGRVRAGLDTDAVRVVAAIAAIAVVVAAVWYLQGRAQPSGAAVAAHAAPASLLAAPGGVAPAGQQSSGPPQPGAATPAEGLITVDVRGAVHHPGVQQLPAGSRIIDAVRAAGGLRGGHGYGPVNLARVLVDGEQVRIGPGAAATGAPPAVPGATPDAGGTAPAGTALVDLNTATEQELEALDGIGPVLAGNIVEWRTSNGPFRSVDDLLDVSGIGDQTLAGLRDQVTVG